MKLIGYGLLGILLMLVLFSFLPSSSEEALTCVPASCCHATSCVPADQAPVCEAIRCTQECQPGTLDCGQASCQLQNDACIVVPHA